MNREAKIRHLAASTIGAAQIDRTQRGQVGEVQKRPNNYNGASLTFTSARLLRLAREKCRCRHINFIRTRASG